MDQKSGQAFPHNNPEIDHIWHEDKETANWISQEYQRQCTHIELIASENFVSPAVRQAQGSVLTHKYAEGYPGKRYYGGCEKVDGVEALAISRACALFGCQFANVQPHSGSQANQAVFFACLRPGDRFLAMGLRAGGHLTHGAPVNMAGRWFEPHFYGVDTQSHRICMDEVRQKARAVQPKLIIAGASAYPRKIDFAAFRSIADEVGSLLLADIAHIAGLVAAGVHPSPFPHAHVVTTTTHKTLRGPRGGMILCDDPELARALDSAIFPGIQGGPLMHVIAAKAISFGQALSPGFASYAQRILNNAQALAKGLQDEGLALVSDGTDNHLILVDFRQSSNAFTDLSGHDAQLALQAIGITCNKNSVPQDHRSAHLTSGIRLGTPAMTTRGATPDAMAKIAQWIAQRLRHPHDDPTALRQEIQHFCQNFPLFQA